MTVGRHVAAVSLLAASPENTLLPRLACIVVLKLGA